MKAVILAAGRGARLGAMTESSPKCLVQLSGQPLILWQLRSLIEAGITDITVVTGYCGKLVESLIEPLGINTLYNTNWSHTNMVSTLLCAAEVIDEACVVSYSDIVYGPRLVKKLSVTDVPLGVAVDLDWLELWSARFENPLTDAESLRLSQDGYIVDIGRSVEDYDEIDGQFMGLIRVTPESVAWMYDVINGDSKLLAELDMTGLLARLISVGRPVRSIETRGNWCEIDTQSDLVVATNLVKNGKLDDYI